jgi:hypothetical protein
MENDYTRNIRAIFIYKVILVFFLIGLAVLLIIIFNLRNAQTSAMPIDNSIDLDKLISENTELQDNNAKLEDESKNFEKIIDELISENGILSEESKSVSEENKLLKEKTVELSKTIDSLSAVITELKNSINSNDIVNSETLPYDDNAGDKPIIESISVSNGAQVVSDFWNKVTPFTVERQTYSDTVSGVKINAGYIYNPSIFNSNNWYCGLVYKIDNSNLEYTTIKWKTAVDDLSKKSGNAVIETFVYGDSNLLGYHRLSTNAVRRDTGINDHEANIKGYETIYVCINAYDETPDKYPPFPQIELSTSEDFLLIWEPLMYK